MGVDSRSSHWEDALLREGAVRTLSRRDAAEELQALAGGLAGVPLTPLVAGVS